MDSEDLLEKALLPGERIVWADRPAGLLWIVRVLREEARASTVAAYFAIGVASIPVVLLFLAFVEITLDTLRGGEPTVLAFLAPAIGALVFWLVVLRVREVLAVQTLRYAVTDRGRGLVAWEGNAIAFELPAELTTRASAGDEFGDVSLGEVFVENTQQRGKRFSRQVTFRNVSYPLIALESIRAASLSGKKAGEAR